MFLKPEEILALKSLKGFGSRTMLKIVTTDGEREVDEKELYSVVLALKPSCLEGVSVNEFLEKIDESCDVIEKHRKQGIGVLSYFDPKFPANLRNCVDEKGVLSPPFFLFYRGSLDVFKKKGIAVIGTREPTTGGEKAGRWFASRLASEGFNIISGLALGCDSCGHCGALDASGVTTAILANGLDWSSVYPRENVGLARRIIENGGLLLSEYPIGERASAYTLVARDRLQAGLADATLVIQTSKRGGSMHAASATMKAKKPLFAVEYKETSDRNSEKSVGNLDLFAKGAQALTSSSLSRMFEQLNITGEQMVADTLF